MESNNTTEAPNAASNSNPNDPSFPDIQQLVIEPVTPSAPSTPAENPTSRSSTPVTGDASNTRPPKPDGPKRTDPFQFGSRFLNPEDDPFEYNAWDHVETNADYDAYAEQQYEAQRKNPVSAFNKKRFNEEPEKWWDKFYKNNQENFFKDRKWLQQEFPILSAAIKPTSQPIRVLEVGCGAGNTLFPVLSANENPNFHIHGCDFSKVSVNLIKSQPLYEANHPKHISASVWDLGNAEGVLPEGVEDNSIDIIILIFVFSALHPNQWRHAVRNVKRMLKDGGRVLFRDYGRGDLAQVRFKKERYIEENFYARGDGTRVYFFSKEELQSIFVDGKFPEENSEPVEEGKELEEKEALSKSSNGIGNENGVDAAQQASDDFKILNLGVDRRMIVNRAKKLKMYRCWLQALFVKGDEAAAAISLDSDAQLPYWMRAEENKIAT